MKTNVNKKSGKLTAKVDGAEWDSGKRYGENVRAKGK